MLKERKKEMQKKTKIIPGIMWIPLIFTFLFNHIVYYGSRLLVTNKYHYNISGYLDKQIPFLPWTILIYWGCYIFWIINYVIACRQKTEKAFCFISADFFAKIICLFCFILFPTTNIRPIIEGNSIFDELMRILYQIDAADNLFPSIHCLTSCFCFIAVRQNKKVPKWYVFISFFIAISVYISTLTTKQHTIIDVLGGIVLAEGSYLFVQKSGFSKWYQCMLYKFISLRKGGIRE